ncbi:MAG: tetratricopeptide repeat protein [Candidatus Contendobacter sp.]|nr:tetratricopeptide repeat protein [Candidatus Contendobacter sp.]MDS4060687.1 tetratricopeptide repeat protein [Candidatus Contendobacter sp.]
MNCPVCPAKNIAANCLVCENCGADLAPIRRIHELAAWRYNTALAFVSHGDHSAAIRELQAALGADPSAASIRVLLGKVLWKAGRTGEAIDEWRRVADEHPDDDHTKSLLGQAKRTRARRFQALAFAATLGVATLSLCSFVVGRITGNESDSVSATPSASSAAVLTSQPVTPSETKQPADVAISAVINQPSDAQAANPPNPIVTDSATLAQSPALTEAQGDIPTPTPKNIDPLTVTPKATYEADKATSKTIDDLSIKLGALEGLRVEQRNDTIRVIPTDGLFPFGSADAYPRGAALLQSIADAFKATPEPVRVRVVGFTDAVPSRPGGRWIKNGQLALHRAANTVVTMKSDNQHEWLASIGDERNAPCPNDSNTHRRCNRTVVIEIQVASNSR